MDCSLERLLTFPYIPLKLPSRCGTTQIPPAILYRFLQDGLLIRPPFLLIPYSLYPFTFSRKRHPPPFHPHHERRRIIYAQVALDYPPSVWIRTRPDLR